MVIKEILSRYNKNFTATMMCEFCGHEEHNPVGYHDAFYLTRVIPAMHCGHCGRKSEEPVIPK